MTIRDKLSTPKGEKKKRKKEKKKIVYQDGRPAYFHPTFYESGGKPKNKESPELDLTRLD
jgi:hypothetical protein